jgi:hypothetical protein
MSELYEVVIFTASLSQYARPLVNRLDKLSQNIPQLYREHCTFHNGMYFVKDLSKLGRDMKDVIIIDNSPSAYLFQPENAIPIVSWYQNKSDKELSKLIPFLTNLAKVDDVRKFLSSPKAYCQTPVSQSTKASSKIETPKAMKVSKSTRILFHDTVSRKTIQTGSLKVEAKTDRINTEKQKYRSSVKRAQINPLFQNNTETNSIKKWMNKRTSNSSRKPVGSPTGDLWKVDNFVSSLQTPKHSVSDECKLLSQTKYTTNCEEASRKKLMRLPAGGSPTTQTYKERLLSKYSSQPGLLRSSTKRQCSPKMQNQAHRQNMMFANRGYYLNGNK